MARSINSPGVQITETDLSVNQQIGGGTNVFVAGFAPQGPTDEVLAVTTVSEFEQIYGTPQTAAERYFYYNCKEVLNSPATLLTTRLPYGSGSGDGFATQYSALLFPVASAGNSFNVGAPVHITFDDVTYKNFLQNNFAWTAPGTTLNTSTTSEGVSAAYGIGANLSATFIRNLSTIDPTPATYDVHFNTNGTVDITFGITLTSTVVGTSTAGYDSINNLLNAGIVVINDSQTTQNEGFEGYYVSLADNTNFGPNLDFNSVIAINGLTAQDSFTNIPTTRIGFSLSASAALAGTGSISETIEKIPTYNFGDAYYNDSLIVTLFKVRNSIYQPQILNTVLAESYIGSLNANKKVVSPNGGTQKSFFLGDVVSNSSSNITVLVNPYVSQKSDWSTLSSANPGKSVRVSTPGKVLAPVGVFNRSYTVDSDKKVGDVISKLNRALTFIDTPETSRVDIVADAGLSTIYANASGYYDDTVFQPVANLSNANDATVARWRTVFNTFNNFVQNTRKDCVFLSDPIRQIFVNGARTKTLSLRGNTFTTNIYTPLLNMYSGIDTNYSAAYANWLATYDSFSDNQVYVPASGYVAAVYARTDYTSQPWIAPAGLNRGSINNIVDLAFNPNQKQRDFLYTISLNPIVLFSGDGYVVYGQKTLQNKPSAFDRINVRRLFLSLERAVNSALRYYVFEPNTDFTRTRLRNSIAPIFDLAKNTQGLYDYLIVCDERNNTPDLIDRNELAVDIYLKPVKAAEYILVNFIATRTGQNFQELI